MKPQINKTKFGSIVVAGERYEHDIVIRLDGKVEKRKKKLSKSLYGTSHIISLDEAKDLYQGGAKWILVGTGQSGMVTLSPQASAYFEKNGCIVHLLPTPEAILFWNEKNEPGIGLFHVTC